MRTIVDLPDAQVAALDRMSQGMRRSRAALIREAVERFLARSREDTRRDAFGLWGPDAEDGLAYQERMRSEW